MTRRARQAAAAVGVGDRLQVGHVLADLRHRHSCCCSVPPPRWLERQELPTRTARPRAPWACVLRSDAPAPPRSGEFRRP
jgi:hypothetical protein